ncbi:hypothetical protein CONPUDRAFT_131199 [Coniophora puteana RWD-64-598 SS2]|uniref:ABC transporter domain-containing protein n=1 Tax=Coniophora puteana (strain RWD-64-598) TaxID=741705 RepID=A0A5M3MAF5_CONPW|nr:uncharacterized protein CONPUDRAFT_131199 [Coniophora puteana RWD-64-598 SS2]EIW75760.1 hypothetical protein CONPUDRAFT_131199 [Coniophora puteana RWD-64-598 SS2]
MSVGLFLRQFWALWKKNWIIIWKHKWLNLFRCLLLPALFAGFMLAAQEETYYVQEYSLGSPIPVKSLQTQFSSSKILVWADNTNSSGSPAAYSLMSRITNGFSDAQQNSVVHLGSSTEFATACTPNLAGYSTCFAGITFDALPGSWDSSDNTIVNYTLSGDSGLGYIDVLGHTSDFEDIIMPLQWAVDQAIIYLRTGQDVDTPLEWPFSQETDSEQNDDFRTKYIRNIRNYLMIVMFFEFIPIAYHLGGWFSTERATLLAELMKAMGLLDSARVISWHVTLSVAYIPGWVAAAVIWHYVTFTKTTIGLLVATHVLTGLSLASWTLFVTVPLMNIPQLAALAPTVLSILFAAFALLAKHASTTGAFVYTVVFPPGFYVFSMRAICGWESHLLGAKAGQGDPDNGLVLTPLFIAAAVSTVMWPVLAIWLESAIYDSKPTVKRPWVPWLSERGYANMPSETHLLGSAVSIRNLKMVFPPSLLGRKNPVVAIEDLSLDVPTSGIFVLLGSNGAGKSTTLSVLGGLLTPTSGSIVFAGGRARPPRGGLGIVPQKDILFPDLTCLQILRVWRSIKHSSSSPSPSDADLRQLLRDCGLSKKIDSCAMTMSGGQKRKLQLACGLVGDSPLLLVDECTSGVDPLSRRDIWRVLNGVKHERSIVYTTHFLDEADLLADEIAILASPGKLVAAGSPVALKARYGSGYNLQVTFSAGSEDEIESLAREALRRLKRVIPEAEMNSASPVTMRYHLHTWDPLVIERALTLLENDVHVSPAISSCDVLGTSIEDIFLDVLSEKPPHYPIDGAGTLYLPPTSPEFPPKSEPPKVLADGRRISPFYQALIVAYKRYLIARRSWYIPLLLTLVAILGSCVPIIFVYRQPAGDVCMLQRSAVTRQPLYLPDALATAASTGGAGNATETPLLVSPPSVASFMSQELNGVDIVSLQDNNSFVSTISGDYLNIPLGGLSIPTSTSAETGDTLFAWEASSDGGLKGLAMLNLVSNLLYTQARNTAGNSSGTANPVIYASYEQFPPISGTSLHGLEWLAIFGTCMIIYPAFFAVYVSTERHTSVKAMQRSNGLSSALGLWTGHLMFDSSFVVVISSLVVIAFAASGRFFELGFYWIVLILYGVSATLLAYVTTLFMASPLGAFAVSTGYQFFIFILYMLGYSIFVSGTKSTETSRVTQIFTYAFIWLAPVASLERASFISLDLFTLLCSGTSELSVSELGKVNSFGGPILYLSVTALTLFCILLIADGGPLLGGTSLKCLSCGRRKRLRAIKKMRQQAGTGMDVLREDVARERNAVKMSRDELRVLSVTKAFEKGKVVVDDLSIGIAKDTIFALLGPNGAGKTTTFNMIRGDVTPDLGDILVHDVSVASQPNASRLSLGVCPQFTAIDAHLTVREHLLLYGLFKGLSRGAEIDNNVDSLLRATDLWEYHERLACQLSGGNQRKLALAIALIGNPSVILIDEFSTGVDAQVKRDMWGILRKLAIGKVVVITTHSMEEASALASKVGILSTRLLAIGTLDDLASRYANYQVQFSCRTRDDVLRVQDAISRIPGAMLTDDATTRFEVQIHREQVGTNDASAMKASMSEMPEVGPRLTLARLFRLLAESGVQEYTVEKASLESVFLRVVKEGDAIQEEA